MQTNFLPCKYPIICAPMNQVSDLKLALAVHAAGCFPSLVLPNYMVRGESLQVDKLEDDLKSFMNVTGGMELLFAIDPEYVLNPDIFRLIKCYKIVHIELLNNIGDNHAVKMVVTGLRKTGVKFHYKRLEVDDLSQELEFIDAVTIKGNNAAARVGTSQVSLLDKVRWLTNKYPTLAIIASGGMSAQSDIEPYLDAGAAAVSIGTAFALSSESAISGETKQKMINSSFKDVVQLGEARQNALKFSDFKYTDYNNTGGLREGVKDPTVGHVFVGKAIDSINTIRSVGEIVNDLTTKKI